MKWTIEEENILRENYKKGSTACSKILNRPRGSVFTKMKKLGLKYDIKEKYSRENLIPIINSSKNLKEVFKKLSLRPAGGNYKIIHYYIELYNLDTSHFESSSDRCLRMVNNFLKKDISEYLIENSDYSRTSLKRRLFEEGYLKNICCLCGQDENWNGMKISLIIDHINGISNDNRLENLRIVCPNCNAGLDTFAGRNNKKRFVSNDCEVKTPTNVPNVCDCGSLILKGSKSCIKCKGLKKRKVNRPPMEILLKDIDELGYRATGRKYGVSDNAIRKWIKNEA